METLIGPDGLRVRVVELSGVWRLVALAGGIREPEGSAFIAPRAGAFVAACRTVEELSAVVDLAELRAEV